VIIRTLGAKSGSRQNAPTFLSQDWESLQHRDYVLRRLIERIGFASRLETRVLHELPHDRTLQIQWQDGGSIVLHLDQGLGFWTTRQRIPFAFTAKPEQQDGELAKASFDVLHRHGHSMPMFILDVELSKA
jgi:hypothetical protein